MKATRILGQLKKVSPEDYLAAGKFAPRGVVAGGMLGGLAGGAGAAIGAGAAAVITKRKAKKVKAIELPRVFYLALTEKDVVLIKGNVGVTVTPRDELYRWPRKGVTVVKKGGLRNVRAEFTIKGVEQPLGALYNRGDSSAEEVVQLLSARK